MNKVISAFKKHWDKAVAVFCVVAIVVVTSVSFSSSASADVIEDNDHMDLETDLNKVLTKAILGMDWSEVVAEYFDVFYETISLNYWNVNTSLFPQYGDDGLFTDDYLSENGKKYDGYYMSPPIDWDQFVLYAQERRKSELDSSTLDSNDYVKKNNVDPVKITTDDLKKIYTDYSLMYAPMPTPSQYLYNYQSATGKKETGVGFHQFNPYAPVFRYGKGYGADVGQKTGWSNGCYVLPYLFDDDLNGTYYSWGYWHFYHKTEDSIRYICADYISLADDSDVTHFERAWNMSEKGASYGLATFANYFALCSYNSDTLYLQCSQSTADFSLLQLSLGRGKFLALNGKITDLVSKSFTSFLQASTFTPQTNTADDWGYIMSETPFELFKDQTSIDFSRIPNNYTITINGDTIYDYSITNPDSGDSTSIRKFIDIYDFPDVPDLPDPDDSDDPDTPGVNGNITVSGNVGVNGKIEIDTKPIDININVNSNGGSAPSGTAEAVDLSNYFSTLPEQSETMNDYLKNFFSFLPPQLLAVLLGGIGCAVLCRVLGR